jgi:hypothetical protein
MQQLSFLCCLLHCLSTQMVVPYLLLVYGIQTTALVMRDERYPSKQHPWHHKHHAMMITVRLLPKSDLFVCGCVFEKMSFPMQPSTLIECCNILSSTILSLSHSSRNCHNFDKRQWRMEGCKMIYSYLQNANESMTLHIHL